MSSRKYVHPKVNRYFDKLICDLVRSEIVGVDCQQKRDFFRGSLMLAFDLNYITIDGLLFFTDFLAWLENPLSITNEHKNRWCQCFYEDYVKILDKKGDLYDE